MSSMIKNKTILSLVVVAILAGCSSPAKLGQAFDKMKFKNETEVLEVHADSIAISIKGKIPPKTFSKKAIVKMQPIIKYGDQEKELEPFYLQGEKVKDKKGKVIKYAKGGSFTKTYKVEYLPEYKKAKLGIDYQIKVASDYDELSQCVNGKRDSSTDGTITTSLSVKPTDDVYMYKGSEYPTIQGGTENVTTTTTQPDMTTSKSGVQKMVFYYVINEGKLRDTAFRGPAAMMLTNILKDKNAKITNVTFKSYASPDGEMNKNAELCRQRAASSYTFVRGAFKKSGIKKIYDKDFIQTPDKNEDWNGLKNLVSNSNISGKSELMGIINSSMSLDDKEKALRSHSSWETLKNDYLPLLRRTEVTITGSSNFMVDEKKAPEPKKVRTVDEIKTAAQANMDDLGQNEMLVLAANTDDWKEKERIYKTYTEKYPSDWTGKNNLAAVMIKNDNVSGAMATLEKLHSDYPNNDTVTSNLGVARRLSKKYTEAKGMYSDAKSHGVNENNNLGIVMIKLGDYEGATKSFEASRCDYNTALAFTLKGDYDEAIKRIDCIKNMTADDYYLKAIAGARKQDKTLMSTALTRAVQMDGTIRDRAKADLEFRKMWKSPEFNAAVK
ncbi:MAG: hypothetical protein NTX03_11765 [Bacteroidetes bacterium]|nr:hypothetical protein [Bacteroidota bacterium]